MCLWLLNTFDFVESVLFTFQGNDGIILFMWPRIHNREEIIHHLFIHKANRYLLNVCLFVCFWPGLVLLSAVVAEKI